MGIGSFFGDVASGIGRGVLGVGTLGISELARSNNQELGQAIAGSQNPAEAISKLGQLGTPAAIQLATEIMKQQPAFNPLTPKDVLGAQTSMYTANPLMNNPPDLSGATGQPAPQQPVQGGQPQAQVDPATGLPITAPPVVNPRQLTGDDWLAYLTTKAGPGFANQVKAVAEGRTAPPSGMAMRSPMGQMLTTAVAQYKPDFDFANAAENFKNRQATETEFTKGDAAKNLRSIGTASNHLATLVGQISGVANHDYPALNAVSNFISKETGDSGITKFNQTSDALASELGAVYKGSGHNSDTEIANMRQALDANASPAQKFGALENGMNLMMGRADELAQQYNRGKNLKPGDAEYKQPDDFLSPQAKANVDLARKAIFDYKSKGQVGATQTAAPAQSGNQLGGQNVPAVGSVIKGYKFLGGNPADKASWAKQTSNNSASPLAIAGGY